MIVVLKLIQSFCTILLGTILILSCARVATTPPKGGDSVQMEYAQLLRIENFADYRLVTISDPWRPDGILHQYALVPKSGKVPDAIPREATVIRVPAQNICVCTSVHANLMMEIGARKNIGSICDSKYILSKEIRQLLADGKVADAGNSMNPNIEKIVALKTEAVMMSPFEGAGYGLIEKAGIPVIGCADYMETSALGRAEWIKFYGLLTGRDKEADSLFCLVRDNYLRLKNTAAQATRHPKLLTDMLNGSAWYMPGGNSIYGALFEDAGADYSIGDRQTSGTQALSLEKVMTSAPDADVWIIKYGKAEDYTYKRLAEENKAYTTFRAYRERRIYGCNTLRVPFYDKVPFRPDIMLADIIKIVHPDLLPDHTLQFYSPLK